MEVINNFVKWFNGKKTIIGLIGTNILQLDLDLVQNMNADVKTVLLYVFGLLAAGGLAHKAQKAIKAKK